MLTHPDPAVYYAHLAAKRAVAHERGADDTTGGRPHHGGEIREKNELMDARRIADETGKILSTSARNRLKELTEIEYPRLIPMLPDLGIRSAMWYV